MAKITPEYCNNFHAVAWEQACFVNNDNPLAVAQQIKGAFEIVEKVAKINLSENAPPLYSSLINNAHSIFYQAKWGHK